MSAMPSSGLVGVSTQTTWVCPGRIAARTASTSAMVRDRVLDAPTAGDLVEQPVGAAVGVVGDDDVVAGPEQRAQHGVLAGEAGGEGEPARRRPRARRSTPRARCGSGWRERLYS